MKPRKREAGKNQGLQASELEYKQGETQFANYARLGLLADANQIGAVRGGKGGRTTGFKPRVKDPQAVAAAAAADAGGSAPHHREIEMPPALKTIRKLPEGERTVLRKLIARHGDDFAAMARDAKLNALQHTAAHLRRRVAKMREEDEEDAADAADAVARGEAPPPPRLRHKKTKHPNKAFAKGSKHFN